ncbi:MAG: phytanoyl-CoA dioxygenase family protein [Actinomycetota bacterium]
MTDPNGDRPSTISSGEQLGWAEGNRDAPEIVELREYLRSANGIRGLETFTPTEIDDIVRVFRRDGFVVVTDVLTPEQTAFLKAGCDDVVEQVIAIDPDRSGNRGSHRYSFGATSRTRSYLHRPEWRMLIDLPTLTPIITALFDSDDYHIRAAGGDFCLPGATRYQPLHSDMGDFRSKEASPHSAFQDPRGHLNTRDLPCPYICVNVLTIDATPINGATRQIPGTQHSREPFPTLEQEPEWMRLSAVCPAPAGSVQIRDVRAWHGGTPNLSDDVRSIPNIEFFAPWFREPTTPGLRHEDYLALSAHGRHIARHQVIDSGEELDLGVRLNRTPERLRTPPTPGPE